jgi:hypothetical protein
MIALIATLALASTPDSGMPIVWFSELQHTPGPVDGAVARAYVPSPTVTFAITEATASSTGITVLGVITNAGDQPESFISGGNIYELSPVPLPALTCRPRSPVSPFPPAPTPPERRILPPKTGARLQLWFDLSNCDYVGSPMVEVKWKVSYWSGPLAQGTVSVTLPARPAK